MTNTGKRDATEVVQLYTRYCDDPAGPQKTLRGFQRVNIPAGKTVEVSFKLSDGTFLWWSEKDKDMMPLAGRWQLMYGGSSDQLKTINYNN